MLERANSRESYEEDSSKRFNLWLIQCDHADSPKKELHLWMNTIEEDDFVEQQSFESYKRSIQQEFTKEVSEIEFRRSNQFSLNNELNSSLSCEQIERIKMLKEQRKKEMEEDASFSMLCENVTIEDKKKSIISSFSNL